MDDLEPVETYIPENRWEAFKEWAKDDPGVTAVYVLCVIAVFYLLIQGVRSALYLGY